MVDTDNSRIFSRSATRMAVEVTTDAGVFIDGHLRDVSMNGLWLACSRMLPVGAVCQVAVVLDAGEPVIRFKADGRVVRTDETGMGIEFTEIDEDYVEHLRNLVLYNSQDAERAEDEMLHNPGIKPLHHS